MACTGGGPSGPPQRAASGRRAGPATSAVSPPAGRRTTADVVADAAVPAPAPGPTSPASAPSAPPARALLVGDGVMYDAVPALEAALRAGGVGEVVTAPRFGFGLTRPEAYDWRREWPPLVAAARPDLVVLMVGPWDVRTVDVGGRPLAPGMPGWESFYGALADEAVAVLTAGGARLVWVGAAMVTPDPNLGARVAALNAALRRVATRHARVVFVDAPAALAGPDGTLAPVEVAAGGVPVRVLKPDGEHLCPAGAARLAAAVAAAVPVRPADGWQDGPWRADGRYRWAAGGGCPPP